MPTPSSPSPAPLTEEQVDSLRAELAAGRLPMVWFTEAAVGVTAGRSAKVVALGQPAEGDFVQVRPTGSQDEVSFSPTELTLVKPPRRKKAAEPADEKPAPTAPEPGELLVVRERPARRPGAAAPRQSEVKPMESTPAEAKQSTARQPGRGGRAKAPAPITVTLSSTPEGEWTVEVLAGTRRTVRSQPVAAGAVASAARALGGEIEDAIGGALAAAREQQRARVERLQAELDVARKALADLSE